MRVFLTGGSGFLGSHCAEVLTQQGHEVVALVRPTSVKGFLLDLGVDLVEGDISRPDTYLRALKTVDAVIHVAGVVKAAKKEAFYRINTDASLLLAKTVLDVNPHIRRFVFVSSIAAAGPSPDTNPRPSDLPEQPVTTYGRSKLKAEQGLKALAASLPLVIIRPTIIYGERDREFLQLLRISGSTGFLPTPNMKQVLTYVHVRDVANALVRALDATLPLPFVCHVEDGETYTVHRTAEVFADVLNRRVRPLKVPRFVFKAYCAGSNLWTRLSGRPTIMGLDKVNEALADYWIGGVENMVNILKYQPKIDLKEGLERQVKWARQEGLL